MPIESPQEKGDHGNQKKGEGASEKAASAKIESPQEFNREAETENHKNG